jgi:Ca-activated chloride channel family protein
MFNPGSYENSRPDGVSVLEIIPSPEPAEPAPRRFVPLRRTELHGDLAGPLAFLVLRQVYRFTRQDCDHAVEAVYRFPLPGDAAVTGVRVHFGAVEIAAHLRERHHAEDEYQQAKHEGRQAALLTRETPDVFTLQVNGIEPDQEVIVETSYVQLARAEGPGWSLRVPLTTSPRYVRSDEVHSRSAQGQPLMLLRDPGHRFVLDLALPQGTTVESPTHELAVTPEGNRLRLRLRPEEVVPDRDCVLTWRPPQEVERPTLQVTLHEDQPTGQVYFLAILAPPARKPVEPGMQREVTLLVDHSGSMQGPKWEAADWAVKRFLSGLTDRDFFSLGLFHDQTTWLAKAPKPANAKAVQKAVEFLEKHQDTGGTELGVALEQALDQKRTDGDVARHVLVLTDAEVTDAGRILRLADEEGKQAARRRIDVLCIDAAPNSFLARELAERGGGVAKFLTSAPEEEDITTALDEVLTDWGQPVVAGLRLELTPPSQVEAAGHAVFQKSKAGHAVDLGDLPGGRAIWVVGRVPRGQAKELAFRVLTPADREVAGCRVALTRETANHPALKALFGARRVLGLEYLITSGYAGTDLTHQLARLGYDLQEVLADRPKKKAKVYAENVRADAADLLKKLLVREALNYGLACSETAFVAVRSEKGKPVGETVVVASALPTGWSDSFLSRGVAAMGGTMLCCLSAPAPGASVDSMLMDFDDSGTDVDTAPGMMGALSAAPPPASAKYRRAFARQMPVPASAVAAPTSANRATVYTGVPQFKGTEAILFDSGRDDNAVTVPEEATLVRLQVEFPGGVPDAGRLDPGLALLLFVDDLASPRARVRLADLVQQGGVRPLNIRRRFGERVRLVLVDPTGLWARDSTRLDVSLHWN